MSIPDPDTAVRLTRRRRAPDEARKEALVSARRLLLESGPDAITLKAVGDEIGVTHANLIHHFGSAAGLQSALMESMVRDLIQALDAAVAHLRSDAGAPRALVDQVFDAFDEGGAGRLAAWIVMSGDLELLEPVRGAVHDLVEAIYQKFQAEGEQARHRITAAVLFIALSAFGDAVIGPPLRDMLGRDQDSARRMVARLLPTFLY
ncbi:TetR/AcrR family transcriptional regulator [Phenylobacterium montanum]|uniref:TetR/AcrR family transcriptional regulator n=1 Tax=Phenylobacterium montanum TaxID=2823693 RepID=A0A975G3F0_9CAUL|nr:TetR/AcrR family transcriptional regulator [Caulobacter sp. S6]QUD89787.1 TetR/AcrR family transcriptional regulator [Caulobacter sp. S6]